MPSQPGQLIGSTSFSGTFSVVDDMPNQAAGPEAVVHVLVPSRSRRVPLASVAVCPGAEGGDARVAPEAQLPFRLGHLDGGAEVAAGAVG